MFVSFVGNHFLSNPVPGVPDEIEDWLIARFAYAWGDGDQAIDGWVMKGRWQADGERGYYYQESAEERAWSDKKDEVYLRFLAKHKPNMFLKEMTPMAEHNGQCPGLDLSYPHHQMLRDKFFTKVEKICKKTKQPDHPALSTTLSPKNRSAQPSPRSQRKPIPSPSAQKPAFHANFSPSPKAKPQAAANGYTSASAHKVQLSQVLDEIEQQSSFHDNASSDQAATPKGYTSSYANRAPSRQALHVTEKKVSFHDDASSDKVASSASTPRYAQPAKTQSQTTTPKGYTSSYDNRAQSREALQVADQTSSARHDATRYGMASSAPTPRCAPSHTVASRVATAKHDSPSHPDRMKQERSVQANDQRASSSRKGLFHSLRSRPFVQQQAVGYDGASKGATSHFRQAGPASTARSASRQVVEVQDAVKPKKRGGRSSWLRIWAGKYGKAPIAYQAIAPKQGQSIGFIAKTPKGKCYIAKWALLDRNFKRMPMRLKSLRRTVSSVILEKIAADMYGALGHGFYYVPKFRLATLDLCNRFMKTNALAKMIFEKLVGQSIDNVRDAFGVHLLSRQMDQCRSVGSLKKCMHESSNRTFPFLDYLGQGMIPQYAIVDCQRVPIVGLIEMLAASRLLADSDVFGKDCAHIGYVIERGRNHAQPTAVRMVKLKISKAFNFTGRSNRFVQALHGNVPQQLQDTKNIQFADYQAVDIQWGKLFPKQKAAFLFCLKKGLRLFDKSKVIDFILQRRGAFAKAFENAPMAWTVEKTTKIKEQWQWYARSQSMPEVYGDSLHQAKPAQPPHAVFNAKKYGAVTHQIDEAAWLVATLIGRR